MTFNSKQLLSNISQIKIFSYQQKRKYIKIQPHKTFRIYLPTIIKYKLYRMEIESKQIISHDESKIIIEFFFKSKFNFNEVVEKHKSRHTPTQIIEHIKRVFKKIILDMEYQLMITQKIKSMQLTENNTPEMFDHLFDFSEILTPQQISDFAIYYRNRVSRLTVYQTDLICSDKRLAIYNAFINYAIDNDLFRFSLFKSRPSAYNMSASQMYENPMVLYPSQALQLVYQFFSQALHTMNNTKFYSNNGVNSEENPAEELKLLTPSIEKQIRKDGRYTSPKFFGELLQHNLKNLFLIGLYRVYRTVMRSTMRTCYSWQIFSHKFVKVLDLFDLIWKGILMRIAIYDDPTMPEQIFISKHICKRTPKTRQKIESPLEMGVSGGVTATGISYGKQTRVDRQIKRKRAFMIAKVRQQMAKLITISRACSRSRSKGPKFISLIDQ